MAAEKERKDESEYPNLEGDDLEENDLRVVFDQRDRSKGPAIFVHAKMVSDRVLDLKSLVTMTKRVFGLKLFGIYFIVIAKVGYKLF